VVLLRYAVRGARADPRNSALRALNKNHNEKGVPFDTEYNTPGINHLSKGGVYDSGLTGRVFCDAEDRHMVTLEGLHEFGRAFGKAQSSIRFQVLPGGGIVQQPVSAAEREEISRGIASGSSIRGIAKRLDRAVSTVSREVARHGGRPMYRANEADHQAWESALRPKPCLLAIHVRLQKIVASKLMLDCLPEQVSGWLKLPCHDDESMRVPRDHLP
jgi:hypothetical protein